VLDSTEVVGVALMSVDTEVVVRTGIRPPAAIR